MLQCLQLLSNQKYTVQIHPNPKKPINNVIILLLKRATGLTYKKFWGELANNQYESLSSLRTCFKNDKNYHIDHQFGIITLHPEQMLQPHKIYLDEHPLDFQQIFDQIDKLRIKSSLDYGYLSSHIDMKINKLAEVKQQSRIEVRSKIEQQKLPEIVEEFQCQMHLDKKLMNDKISRLEKQIQGSIKKLQEKIQEISEQINEKIRMKKEDMMQAKVLNKCIKFNFKFLMKSNPLLTIIKPAKGIKTQDRIITKIDKQEWACIVGTIPIRDRPLNYFKIKQTSKKNILIGILVEKKSQENISLFEHKFLVWYYCGKGVCKEKTMINCGKQLKEEEELMMIVSGDCVIWKTSTELKAECSNIDLSLSWKPFVALYNVNDSFKWS